MNSKLEKKEKNLEKKLEKKEVFLKLLHTQKTVTAIQL